MVISRRLNFMCRRFGTHFHYFNTCTVHLLFFIITNKCSIIKVYATKVSLCNLHRVVNGVFFLLGDTPASEFYVPTFRNVLFHYFNTCTAHLLLLLLFDYNQHVHSYIIKVQ